MLSLDISSDFSRPNFWQISFFSYFHRVRLCIAINRFKFDPLWIFYILQNFNIGQCIPVRDTCTRYEEIFGFLISKGEILRRANHLVDSSSLSLSSLLPWRGERNGLCMINSLIFSTSSSSSGINIISIYFKILLQHQIRRSRTYSVPFIVDRIMTRFNSTLHNVIELGYIVIPCGYLTGCHRWSGMRPID